MQWEILFGEDLRVSIKSNPHIDSLNRYFFELPIVRVPFFLDFFSLRRDFYTETCGIQFPDNQEADNAPNLIEAGCINITGHYTKGGFMEEDAFRRLLLEYSNTVLLKFKDDTSIQEKWEYNRRKEWFSNLEYYEYFVSFPAHWKVAMEEGIKKIEQVQAR